MRHASRTFSHGGGDKVSAIYMPCGGGLIQLDHAIYDRTSESVDPDTGAVYRSTQPVLGVRITDMKGHVPKEGDQVKIDGCTFNVIDHDDDGQAGYRLMLHEYD